MMKSNINIRALTSFFILLFITASCGDSEEEEIVVPKYVGSWERVWFNEELNANLRQMLVLNEADFSSEIYIQTNDSYVLYKEFSGTQAVIDNTLTAYVKSLKVLEDGIQTINTNPNESNFDDVIFAALTIHSTFIGAWFFVPGELTLRLDLDGDGSVTGDEGLFVFYKI